MYGWEEVDSLSRGLFTLLRGRGVGEVMGSKSVRKTKTREVGGSARG